MAPKCNPMQNMEPTYKKQKDLGSMRHETHSDTKYFISLKFLEEEESLSPAHGGKLAKWRTARNRAAGSPGTWAVTAACSTTKRARCPAAG